MYEPPRTGLSSFLPSFLFKDTTPSVKLTANTYTINPNSSVILSWDSSNTSNCFILSSPTIPDFSGSVPSSGSKTISNISQTTLFSIMCTKDTLSTFDYISVNVNQGLNIANVPLDTSPITSSTTGTQTPPISTIALTPSSKSSSSNSSKTTATKIDDPVSILSILNKLNTYQGNHIFVHFKKNISLNSVYKIDFFVVFSPMVQLSCVSDVAVFKEIVNQETFTEKIKQLTDTDTTFSSPANQKTKNLISKTNVKYYQLPGNRGAMSFSIEDRCDKDSIVRFRVLVRSKSTSPVRFYSEKDSTIKGDPEVIAEVHCGDTSNIIQAEQEYEEGFCSPQYKNPNICTMALSDGGGALGLTMIDASCLNVGPLPLVNFNS